MPAASFRRPLTVHARVSEGVVTVIVSGELDICTGPALQRVLADVLKREPKRLILDLAGVTFIDCASARMLLAASRALPAGRKAVIRRPSPAVERLLRLVGTLTDFWIEMPGTGSLRPGPGSTCSAAGAPGA